MALLRRGYLLASLSVLPFQAHAQTSPTPEANSAQVPAQSVENPADDAAVTTDEIIVTAQRREQRLQDVPIAVSVTTGAQLNRQNLVNLEAIATRLPSVRVARNSNSDTIAVRGISSGQNAGFEQAVGIFVDGIYRGRSRGTRSAVFDAERVEVLKGPQTTYFGNNTVAGALNITTRKPKDVFGIQVRTLYTPRIGEYLLNAAVEGPIGDTLSYRIVGEASGMNGYVFNRFEGEDGPHNRDLAGRISLRWKPVAGVQSDLRFDRVRNRDRNTDISEVTNCPAPAVYGRTAGACALYLAARGSAVDTTLDYTNDTAGLFFRYDMTEVEWTNRFDVGDSTLTSTTSYFHHDAAVTSNSQPLALATPFPGIVTRGIFQNIERNSNFSQELRLESGTGRTIQYALGAYYLHDNLRSNGLPGFYTAPFGATLAPSVYSALDPIALNRQLSQKTDTLSAFGVLTATPLRGLRVNLGGRYTHVRKVAHRYAVYGKAGPVPGFDNFVAAPAAVQGAFYAALGGSNADFAQPQRSFDKFMPSASIQYDVTSGVTLYGSFTKGFKAGGFAESSAPNVFDSETVTAYEIGAKGSIAGTGLFFAVDAFTSTFSNLQVAYTIVQANGVTNSLIANAAAARSRGVEGSFNYRVSPAVTLRADVAYVDSIYTSYPNAACSDLLLAATPTGCVQDQTGRTRPFAPKWSGSASAQFTAPLWANEVTFEPLVYFTSRFNVSESLDPNLEQGGYAKIDARIGYGPASGKWEIALIGKNLTDERTFNYARPVGTSRGSYYASLEMPRTISIAASVRY